MAGAPATSQAKIEAKKNGKIYGTTIITTPNNMELEESKWCKNVLIGQACRFDEAYYDYTIDELEEILSKKSDNGFFYIEFSYKQLGRDEEWFKEQCRSLNNDLLLIKREILLEWTKASDVSVYTEEQLDGIEKYLKEAKGRLTLQKYYYLDLYYNDIDFTKPYIIAGDVALGKELDASTICLIDPLTLDIIGELRENTIPTEDYKKVIFELATRYFINGIIVLENNTAEPILEWLIRSPIKNRIYYEYAEKTVSILEKDKREVTHRRSTKKTRVYGINTNTKTRGIMLEMLDEIINNNPDLLATPFVFSDIKGLERDKKTGKIEHGDGNHDDSLFGYLVGIYCLGHGKNLSRFMLPINGRSVEERNNTIIRINAEISKSNNKDYKREINPFQKMFTDEYHNENINQNHSKQGIFFNSLINTSNENRSIDIDTNYLNNKWNNKKLY